MIPCERNKVPCEPSLSHILGHIFPFPSRLKDVQFHLKGVGECLATLPVFLFALESLTDFSLFSLSLSSFFSACCCSLLSNAVGIYPSPPASGDNGGDTTDSESEMSDLTDFIDDPPQLSAKSLLSAFSSAVVAPLSNKDNFGFCLPLLKLLGDLVRGEVTGGDILRASSLSTSSSASLSSFRGPEFPRGSLMSSSGSERALLTILR